jgi:hypothetical protein
MAALAAQFRSWHEPVARVTVVKPNDSDPTGAATMTLDSGATPSYAPRLVPATDLALRVDGVKHLVVWFAPTTALPDEIDDPDDQAIYVRTALIPPRSAK